MGEARKPERVKLIIGMLAKDKKLFDCVEEFFVDSFGKIDYKSLPIRFDQTDYYKKEMGSPLEKVFFSFKKLIPPDRISKIKLETNLIEERFTVRKDGSGARQVNIDPGYVSDSKLVLATTKDYFHRLYLKNGIYAEVTLAWKKDGFQPFDWTYPDYKTKQYRDVLNNIRNMYMKERRAHER